MYFLGTLLLHRCDCLFKIAHDANFLQRASIFRAGWPVQLIGRGARRGDRGSFGWISKDG
jgi:hypothetical protein